MGHGRGPVRARTVRRRRDRHERRAAALQHEGLAAEHGFSRVRRRFGCLGGADRRRGRRVSRGIGDLLRIMAALRDPKAGCPWDVEQNFDTIAPYTIEEAYEVADAIDRRDFAGLRDELGDLLLQVVFHARMAEEAGHFRFDDVVEAICDKMTRRHPHVFPDANGNLLSVADSEAQTSAWEERKRVGRRVARPAGVAARAEAAEACVARRLRLAVARPGTRQTARGTRRGPA